jgi:hypothetical protein
VQRELFELASRNVDSASGADGYCEPIWNCGCPQGLAVVADKHVPIPRITTVLIPNRLRNRADLYKTELSSEGGHFEMHGIPPGDYKLFAWEAIEAFSWFDPEVIRRIARQIA